jgi:flagellar hook-basal body complex protein FliE
MDVSSLTPAALAGRIDELLNSADLKSRVNDLLASTPTSLTETPTALPGLEGGPAVGSVIPAFSDVLGKYLQQVDATQKDSDAMVQSLALGEPVDVHQVMLSLNEASNAMQLTLQVRNKVLEAYQELMRLPL